MLEIICFNTNDTCIPCKPEVEGLIVYKYNILLKIFCFKKGQNSFYAYRKTLYAQVYIITDIVSKNISYDPSLLSRSYDQVIVFNQLGGES